VALARAWRAEEERVGIWVTQRAVASSKTRARFSFLLKSKSPLAPSTREEAETPPSLSRHHQQICAERRELGVK
jgi:hypothetical protein